MTDWTADSQLDPHAGAGRHPDLRVEWDSARDHCPVQRREDGSYMVFGHPEVVTAGTDAEAFSSAVSRYRAIPNSLDGAEHRAFRAVIERYLTPERVAEQEPQCRAHAAAIVGSLPRGEMAKTVTDLGTPYAVRTQCTWLGWPDDLEGELVAWMGDNREASRSGDGARTAAVADAFDAIIGRQLAARRASPRDDVTSELMAEEVDGRPLTDAEIVSILRNWTAGDLGSLATSLGVIVHHLATDVAQQAYLRSLVAAGEPVALEAALEEILRIDDPFVSNRRVTTRPVALGGVDIPEDTRILLNWTAANRDPRVFDDPDSFHPTAHARDNIVFGVGPHICPGRDLTLMELRVAIEELLARTTHIAPAPDWIPEREQAPVSGWAKVPVVLDPVGGPGEPMQD